MGKNYFKDKQHFSVLIVMRNHEVQEEEFTGALSFSRPEGLGSKAQVERRLYPGLWAAGLWFQGGRQHIREQMWQRKHGNSLFVPAFSAN
jgi:hypothetical protein